jgi:hypothetical protein
METQMRTLTKAIFGMAMLAGSALAIATPANAQSSFGLYFGNGAPRGIYVDRNRYDDRGGFLALEPVPASPSLDSRTGLLSRTRVGS